MCKRYRVTYGKGPQSTFRVEDVQSFQIYNDFKRAGLTVKGVELYLGPCPSSLHEEVIEMLRSQSSDRATVQSTLCDFLYSKGLLHKVPGWFKEAL